MFSHEAEVGVKCMLKRGCLASHSFSVGSYGWRAARKVALDAFYPSSKMPLAPARHLRACSSSSPCGAFKQGSAFKFNQDQNTALDGVTAFGPWQLPIQQ
jgi:hypothetical protein